MAFSPCGDRSGTDGTPHQFHVRLLANMPLSQPFPLEVVVTPRFDVFYALHALASEAPTPLESWKENAARRLPRDFARAARRIAPIPIFWPLLADALQGTPGAMTFDDVLSTLSAMPVNELKANILGGMFHDRATVEALLTRKRTLRQVLTDEHHPDSDLLSHFGLRPYNAQSAAAGAMSNLLSDAVSYRDELSLVLQKFRQSAFGADWSSLEPVLRTDASRLKARGEENSIADLAAELRLPAIFDENSGVMRTKSGTVVKLRQIERCYLVPSAFNTRRWWAKYETTGERLTLYFPIWTGAAAANALSRAGSSAQTAPRVAARARTPVVNAEAVFRALGDTTRYAIASILARSPTSSADLSRTLKVSKPTITHHVHALRSAGLITEKMDGGSSLLSLNRDTLAALSEAAIQDLYSSTGELQLLTTRQRRVGPKKV